MVRSPYPASEADFVAAGRRGIGKTDESSVWDAKLMVPMTPVFCERGPLYRSGENRSPPIRGFDGEQEAGDGIKRRAAERKIAAVLDMIRCNMTWPTQSENTTCGRGQFGSGSLTAGEQEGRPSGQLPRGARSVWALVQGTSSLVWRGDAGTAPQIKIALHAARGREVRMDAKGPDGPLGRFKERPLND